MLLSLKHGVDYVKNNKKKNVEKILCLKLLYFQIKHLQNHGTNSVLIFIMLHIFSAAFQT